MAFVAVTTPIVLPWPLQSSLEAMARVLLEPGDRSHIDFSRPVGEAALLSPESVSWRVFKNPLSLFIGGVTAVIMELAEPRVRTGLWEHTTFRLDPIRRLRRTGLAAMVTIYGARSTAEPMIARIRRMHEMVAGTTASGEAYRANDSELLNWVHGTAAYGFLQAYHMYVQPLSSSERDRYYAEGVPAASLYGASGAPTSEIELEMLFHAMAGRLERSDIVFEFLTIMRSAAILPLLLRPAQDLLVRAGVDLTPNWVRTILGLNGHGLHPWEAEVIRQAGAFAARAVLASNPAVQACRLVQKPCAVSLHVAALLLPDSARGSRVIFPSGVKVILNLTPLSVAAVKGWPLKNVAWMSLGAMGSAAKALLAWKSIVATTMVLRASNLGGWRCGGPVPQI